MKKNTDDFRKEIFGIIKNNFSDFLGIKPENTYTKYNIIHDYGVTEMDTVLIITKCEDELNIELKDEDILESSNIVLFEFLKYYSDAFIKRSKNK